MNSSIAIEYYSMKYGNNTSAAFIHLIREIGEVAFAIENNKPGIAQPKITEAVALLYYLGSKYDFNVEENILPLYTKKIETLKKQQGNN